MKTQNKLSRSLLIVALVTVSILMVPLVAMQFTAEVNWSPGDFIIMGLILFGTGISYVLLTRQAANVVYRIAAAAGLGATLLMVWANLAVGLIGSGPHLGNLMYLGVLAVGITGTVRSHLGARGMERSMYAMALSLILLAGIALAAGMHRYPGSSAGEVIGVNAFFAALFAISGVLFRYAALKQHARPASE